MRRSLVRMRVSKYLIINRVSVQTQRKASQIAHHQKCHKHAYKTLNFTTLHFSKFRNAKLQKKVGLCNSGKSTQKTKMQKTQIRPQNKKSPLITCTLQNKSLPLHRHRPSSVLGHLVKHFCFVLSSCKIWRFSSLKE